MHRVHGIPILLSAHQPIQRRDITDLARPGWGNLLHLCERATRPTSVEADEEAVGHLTPSTVRTVSACRASSILLRDAAGHGESGRDDVGSRATVLFLRPV